MTSYKLSIAILCTLIVASISTAAFASRAVAGPGDAVYTTLMYVWDQAPKKFSAIIAEDDWGKYKAGDAFLKDKYETHPLEFDIPEFEDEEARLIKLRDNEPTDYVISAKKYFTSDAACEEYYQSLLAKLPVLLAKDGVKIKQYDDHIFYKDKTKTYYRKMYVKRYLSDKRDKPRVIVSVRVEFPEG